MNSKVLFTLIGVLISFCVMAEDKVTATINESTRSATMSNGIVTITINSKGHVNSLVHNEIDLIDSSNKGRIYFSYNDQNSYMELNPDAIRIEKQNDDYAEVVYSNTSGDLRIEQAYILRKGVSGIYSYITIKGTSTMIRLREMRLVYRVSPVLFDYGYVTDRMQGYLPSVEEMKEVDGDAIMDATYPLKDGSIYTKYNWANYIAQDSVHGLMSDSEGIWAIPVSAEYINGGPMRQELMVHTTSKTPLVLQMLQGEHFGAAAQEYSTGDEKIYGPFFIYVNSAESHEQMVADAQQQASIQKAQWPFTWLDNPLYETERSSVSGTIKSYKDFSTKGLQIVLAEPGIDIYDQGKKYIFWGKTDANGNFKIDDVIPGNYTLYAYATEGEITDELALDDIEILNTDTDLGNIEWFPAKYEKLIFQLGESDRLSDGFMYCDTVRRYGLYELPPSSLVFDVDNDDPQEDWYYAQTKSGVWQIQFNNTENLSGDAQLTVSVAGAANSPKVGVYINSYKLTSWSFSNDASIYRSAVNSGKHTLKKYSFSSRYIRSGRNVIKFALTDVGNRGGVMYDCIKLEAGDQIEKVTDNTSVNFNNNAVFSVNSYPNPFLDEVTLEIVSEQAQKAKVEIYNVQGELVELVYNGDLVAGSNTLKVNSSDLATGIYYYIVRSEAGLYQGKLIKE